MNKIKNIASATCSLATATIIASNGTVTNCPGLTDDPAAVAGKDTVITFSKAGYANSLDTDLGRAMELKVDFSKNLGKIKPLHGVNNSPVTYGEALPEFTEAGIPFMRTHDTGGTFGGARFIDVSNIFPDMDAEENDPASYDFAFTDAYIKGIIASGTKIFYRLGVTIENRHKLKAYHINPPKDNAKYARICEKIIRHYNEGWANGFNYNIEYWEIWNEPENPNMWTGTMEQFFEFYRVVANHLKNKFPHLKIGGYAGCGFYGMNRHNSSEFTRSFVTWFDEFLKFITDKKTAAPLDFYSWHLYTTDPMEIIMHAEYVEKKLKTAGLKDCENIFNEWNYIDFRNENRWDDMKGMLGATFVGAAFILMQHSPIDKAMYYDALPTRAYCGLYEFPSKRTTKAFAVFKAFNELYQLGTAIDTAPNPEKDLYVLAAKNSDGSKGKMLLVNRRISGLVVKMQLTGMGKAVSARRIDSFRTLEPGNIIQSNGAIVLAPQSVIIIDFEK
ncbi:MAG: hypothetical protein J6W00_03210 [Lentisphaeria bacterium]|nr:hypothetical protein [Lentisphaeria bacterium]